MLNYRYLLTAKHLRIALSAIVILAAGLTICLSSPAQSQIPAVKAVVVEDIIPRQDAALKTDGNDAALPFGADLFTGATPTTTVNPEQPVPAGYIYGSGDKLRIRYWTPLIPEVSIEAIVNRNGMVTLPDIGDIMISGLTQSALHVKLGARLRETLRDPSFAVDLIEPRKVSILVTGAAKRPGMYTVSAVADVFDVVYACGGPSEQGTMRRIEHKRGNTTISVLDTYEILIGGKRARKDSLNDGDVIFFPTVGPRAIIKGEVIRPAIYEISDETTVAELLMLAGGAKASAYTRLLRIERFENGRRIERTLDITAILADPKHADNIRLKDGDSLSMENVSAKIYERVSIRGQVGFPGDYSTQRTPTVKALVTEAKLRKGSYAERADLLRILDDGTPVVVPIPLSRILDGTADDINLQDQDEVIIYRSDEKALIPLVSIEGSVKHPATFRMSEGMKVSDLIFAAGGLLRDAAPDAAHLYRRIGPDDMKIIRVSPSLSMKLSANDDPQLQDEDRLVIYKQRDVSFKSEKVRIVGEVQRPGEFRAYDGLTLYDLLLQAGGATDTAAGTIEVSIPLSSISTVKRAEVATYKLSEVITGAHRDDIIYAGTLVSVPKQGDRISEPWRVELKGQFVQPGTYALLYEGETLNSLMKRAGGFSANADPFGISLTRKRDQMLSLATAEQIKTVLDTMDQLLPPVKKSPGEESAEGADLVATGTPQSAVPGISTAGSAGMVLLVSPRRLNEMPTGKRIAFDLEDRDSYTERLGKVKLTDGDVIEVPKISDVVQVLGAVQSPGPVFYQEGYSANDYLNRAGGGAPDADIGRAVVIKVSGTVQSFKRAKKIDRGDVIVMASKYQIIQPPRKKTFSEIMLDLLGVGLVVRGLK